MTTTWDACDFASCLNPGTVPGGGWWFCADHIRTHRAIEAEDAEPRPARRISPDERARQIAPLVKRGLTDQQIANLLGLSRPHVCQIRKHVLQVPAVKVRPLTCGTRWGHQMHRAHGEKCEPCRVAERAYQQARQERRLAKSKVVA